MFSKWILLMGIGMLSLQWGCGESSSDTDADSDTDTDTDADSDTDTDTDTDTDSGTDMDSCADVGGTCTEQAWVICPADHEPVDGDAPLGCGGHCCVPAPAGFACNESDIVNCVNGSSCDDAPDECWGSAMGPSLACEPGRVCCNWQCW